MLRKGWILILLLGLTLAACGGTSGPVEGEGEGESNQLVIADWGSNLTDVRKKEIIEPAPENPWSAPKGRPMGLFLCGGGFFFCHFPALRIVGAVVIGHGAGGVEEEILADGVRLDLSYPVVGFLGQGGIPANHQSAQSLLLQKSLVHIRDSFLPKNRDSLRGDYLVGNPGGAGVFRVSQFSYNGYRIHQRGTLKYRGSRILSFK